MYIYTSLAQTWQIFFFLPISGQGQLREAEQYLSQAQWTVSQTPSTSSSLRSQLHRNLGLLATARGDFINARKYFAEDVWHIVTFTCT